MVYVRGVIKDGRTTVLNLNVVDRFTIYIERGEVRDDRVMCKLCIAYDNVKIESGWKAVELSKKFDVDDLMNILLFYVINHLQFATDKMIVDIDTVFSITIRSAIETLRRESKW